MALALDYARLLQRHLPEGIVWTRSEDSKLFKLLLAAGDGLARVHERIDEVVRQIDPRAADDLIELWETDLALPDECAGTVQLLQARRQAVHARLIDANGADIASWTDMAAALGFEIEIDEHEAFTTDSRVDAHVNSDDWAHVWRINVLMPPGVDFDEIERAVFECIISRANPAHAIVEFEWIPAPAPGLWFDFTV